MIQIHSSEKHEVFSVGFLLSNSPYVSLRPKLLKKPTVTLYYVHGRSDGHDRVLVPSLQSSFYSSLTLSRQ